MARRIDLDAIARLEEERDYLLDSIRDLDRERDAGDVDEEDYEELRRGYVARAAAAIEALEEHTDELAQRQAAARPALSRRLAWIGGCLVFGVVAAVLLINASASRVGDESLTGNTASPGAGARRCMTLSMSEPQEGIACYDELLADAPDNVTYLTYQGWAFARTDRPEEAMERFDRVVELDPTFPDVWVFIASVRADTGDFAGAQEAIDALMALDPSPAVRNTLASQGLERKIALGLLGPDAAACWEQTETAGTQLGEATSSAGDGSAGDSPDGDALAKAATTLADAVKCFEGELDAHRDNAQFLTLRSFTLGLLATIDNELAAATLPTALASADEALVIDPQDPTALLLRATWNMWLGDYDASLADLDALGDREISPLVSPYVGAAEIRAEVTRQASASGG
ncbi:MAG: tetratricopeptide repeat protein [Microthrixaceae bacterium]|nr:tetratricopeptide repeat protein [Microthrixaceae bacterium]MCO5313519.1 tetratricopeptide repeat protein [Microthrixaceae bacterium]